jgi:hypothetical protein
MDVQKTYTKYLSQATGRKYKNNTSHTHRPTYNHNINITSQDKISQKNKNAQW